MKKISFLNSFKKYSMFPVLLLCTYSIITKNDIVRSAISSAMDICFKTLIPSVFPMLILSSLFIYVKCPQIIIKIADKILYKLFGLSGNSFIILLSALTQGYPIAAKSASAGYNNGIISKKEAKILTLFFTCPGLSFAVTVAGTVYFNSAKTGFSILSSCIISEMILCAVAHLPKKVKKEKTPSAAVSVVFSSDIFVSCVSDASASIISLCAWVLCFSVISSLFISYIKIPIIQTVTGLLSEVTGALIYTSETGNLPLCAACLCFGGLSVACQISPELKKLGIPFPLYLLTRFLCGILAYNIEYLLMYLFPQSINVSSGFYTFKPFCNSAAGSVSLLILCIVFLLSITKENRNYSFLTNK